MVNFAENHTPMNLVIDKGNSLWKVAVFDDNQIVCQFITEMICAKDFDQLVKKYNISKGIVSNVSDQGIDVIESLRKKIKLYEWSQDLQLPLIIEYKTPQTLGKDRIAAVVGAINQFPDSNILVIDAGTCVTYDLVKSGKYYLGGAISPGIEMRFKALHNFTGKLPLVKRREITSNIGTTTEESILSGVINGLSYEIEGMIETYDSFLNNSIVVFTGGDADYFVKRLKNPIFVDLNLVLKGLKIILDYNV